MTYIRFVTHVAGHTPDLGASACQQGWVPDYAVKTTPLYGFLLLNPKYWSGPQKALNRTFWRKPVSVPKKPNKFLAIWMWKEREKEGKRGRGKEERREGNSTGWDHMVHVEGKPEEDNPLSRNLFHPPAKIALLYKEAPSPFFVHCCHHTSPFLLLGL